MTETLGVLIAIVSSSLGGTAAAVTRYLVSDADAVTLAILRWGIGFLCLLPVALLLRVKWPQRTDWLAVAALGIAFFGLFFVLYNIAMSYTTAARAALALSTLPLQTMVVGALLGHRAADMAQNHRRLHRDPRHHRRARDRSGVGAARRLARRIDHGRRRSVHGVLHRVVAAVCAALERARFPHRRHGRRRGRVDRRRPCDRPGRGAGELRPRAMDGRSLSRCRRRRARFHSVDLGAGAHHADPRHQHHDGQPDRGGSARDAARRRADHAQSRASDWSRCLPGSGSRPRTGRRR